MTTPVLPQYPHERPVLFPPLTGIEIQGEKMVDDVKVVEIRLSINQTNDTIEKVNRRRCVRRHHCRRISQDTCARLLRYSHHLHLHPPHGSRHGAQVNAKMQNSHLELLKLLLDNLTHAGTRPSLVEHARFVRCPTSH